MEKRSLAAIMFTDIVGYTRLMGVDEEKALKVLENNRDLHRDLLILYDGQKLKEIGDGMLCSFDSASKAVKCAIELIRKSNEYDDLKLRIGIHVGEVVFSGNDVFGDGVNIASRIEAMAIADSVLISEKVYDEIRNKQNLRTKLLGNYLLKNDSKKRDIYAIANAKLKVPESKHLSIIEDRPDLQSISNKSTPAQEPQIVKKRVRLSSARVGLTILFSLMSLAFGSFLFISFRNNAKVKWAREEAIIKIEESIEKENYKEAFHLAEEAEKYISNDPLLERLWPKMQSHLTMDTDPTGAHVYRKLLGEPDSEYELVGVTPLDSAHTYRHFSIWKIVKEGFDSLEVLNMPQVMQKKTYRLFKPGELPENMLYVHFNKWDYWPTGWISGLGDVATPHLNDFLVDQYEVTNKAYKKFVDQGGYTNKKFWKEPFIQKGLTLSWDEAIANFVDKTGQLGPATWEIGDYPPGQDDFPVSGINWYEAMAYAEFAGKSLPSLYHWIYTATPGRAKLINPNSNFLSKGTNAVGSSKSLGWYGTYDLAGNVREWCLNKVPNQEDHYIQGGAWDESPYNYTNARAIDPFDRSPMNGFRCIRYLEKNENEQVIASNVPLRFRDFTLEQPVNEETFQHFLHDFEYDKRAFQEEIKPMEFGEPDFTCEKILINSPYNKERLCLYLFLPANSIGSYQTIFYFPSAWALGLNDFETTFEMTRFEYDFFIKSGRAVAIPVLSGMYGREEAGKNLSLGNARRKANFNSMMIDVQRFLDYLESRSDIDSDKIGYYGFSLGAALGPVVLAVEDRFKVAVLTVAGLGFIKPFPENDQINYLPRATKPILMLNGRYDHVFPFETSSKLMFEYLGTSQKHKKQIVYDVGHTGPPRYEIIKESLNWFDTYLGPVEPDI